MTGTEIGSYRILEKLGEGGMGVVYKAVDTSLDRPVAVKVLNPDLTHNPELVARFRSEAKAQANLNHTNLATLYAFIVQDGHAAMVMEFVDGETFEQMIARRGPLPAEEAVPLFRQVLLGIGYAHRAGIVHRDIKPSNLMLNRNGIVKVMDFGIAKVMGVRGVTRTGTQMGTGTYMSPEQVLNKPVDVRSDIYSLGVTLYQMLTAHVPFEGDSDFQIMSDHVSTPPPLLTRFNPKIPKGIENAVLKALEKYPEYRFQTVEEFGTALEHPNDFTYSKGRGATILDSEPAAAAGSVTGQSLTPAQMVARFAIPRAAAPPPPTPAGLLATPQRKITAIGVALLVILVAAALALKLNKGDSARTPPASQAQIPAGQTPLGQRLANSGSSPVMSGDSSQQPAAGAQAVPGYQAPIRAQPPAVIPQAAVAFNVVHDHGGMFRPGGAPACWGRLRVSGGRLEYHVVGSNDGRRDELIVPAAQVQQVQANLLPIRNQQAFHIVVNGQTYNFIPQGMSGVQAAGMLERAIQGR